MAARRARADRPARCAAPPVARYFILTFDCTVCELLLTVTFLIGQGGRATCSQCETVYDLDAHVRIVKRGRNRA